MTRTRPAFSRLSRSWTRTDEDSRASASGDALEGHGDRATAAEAQRRQPVAALAPPKFVKQRRDDARPRRPDRMAERNRSAIDVDLRPVEPELPAVGQRLGGECLVDLDQVEGVDR